MSVFARRMICAGFCEIVECEDNEDVNHCSIGWIKSPEDTESFKLSINAPSAKVIIVVIVVIIIFFYVNLNVIF